MVSDILRYEYLSGKGLFAFVEARPVEVINIIRKLFAGRTLKGNCPMCKEWQ